MAEFEDQQGDAAQISREIAGKLVALGVDWNDPEEMRALAREALDFRGSSQKRFLASGEPVSRLKLELFGLIGLMLKTMEEGASFGGHIHGSEVWKAMARALWDEKTGSSAK